MRKNKVPLNSLSVGRCFTLPVDPTDPAEAASLRPERPETARVAKPILAPEHAWRIADLSSEGAHCVSASGESKRFEADAEVVEIPRQGFETLAKR